MPTETRTKKDYAPPLHYGQEKEEYLKKVQWYPERIHSNSAGTERDTIPEWRRKTKPSRTRPTNREHSKHGKEAAQPSNSRPRPRRKKGEGEEEKNRQQEQPQQTADEEKEEEQENADGEPNHPGTRPQNKEDEAGKPTNKTQEDDNKAPERQTSKKPGNRTRKLTRPVLEHTWRKRRRSRTKEALTHQEGTPEQQDKHQPTGEAEKQDHADTLHIEDGRNRRTRRSKAAKTKKNQAARMRKKHRQRRSQPTNRKHNMKHSETLRQTKNK